MHICQAEVATGVVECQSFVIQAKTVQDGGLKIVNVDRIFSHVKSKVVGCSARSL